jgi:hypothetical protein
MASQMSLARRATWFRLLRRTLVGVALVAGAAALVTGCREEDDVSTGRVGLKDLRMMVVPRDELGLLAYGLKVNDRSSGWVTNSMSANDSIDPKDSGRSLSKRGRLGGYALTYVDPLGYASHDEERPLAVATALELFSSEAAASAYLRDEVDRAVRLAGRKLPKGTLATAERFGGGDVGDEAEGLRTALRVEGNVGYASYVAFRRGRLVATAAAWRRAETKSPSDARQIADALDKRISGVATGEIDRAPVKLAPHEWWHAAPDPRPLTLEGSAIAAGARRTHRSYLRTPVSFGYLREYELRRGQLGSSRIFYLRTMAQALKSPDLARRAQKYLASAHGSEAITRNFLRRWFRKTDFRPTGITADPLTGLPPGTAAFRFTFDAPAGRVAAVMMSVRRGRLRGNVVVAGLDRELQTGDVLPLREKLLARLATA